MMKSIFSILLLLSFVSTKAQDPDYPAPAPALVNIVAAEYWIDTDPGMGNGTAITITPNTDIATTAATILTTGLSNGIHRYGLRTKNADGKWSHTIISELLVDHNPNYITSPAAVNNIVAAEYWIDTDPGMGNGIDIAITSNTDISNTAAIINTSGLSNGIHRFGLRTKNADGKWSLTNINELLVDHNPNYAASPAAISDIVAAEYFIDTDPGMGNGTAISITAGQNIANHFVSVNTNGLSNAIHYLVVRSKNSQGVWSLSNISPFLVNTDFSYPQAPAAPGNITYAEYFFDSDPGLGNGTIIPITPGVDLANVGFSANTSALTDGVHTLFIRSLDDWSLTNFVSFTKGSTVAIGLLQFSAVANGTKAQLNWQTGTEEITDKMVLQRSADGIHFTDIAFIHAKGTPSSYSYLDEQPFNGRNFYRLKMVDLSNENTFSRIESVYINGNDGFKVTAFPNPVTDKLQISTSAAIAPAAYITICNMGGKEMLRQTLTTTNQEINMAGQSNGVYLLRVINGQQQQSIKVVKQ